MPSAGRGWPAPWRWDPAMAAYLWLLVMAAARVEREKGGWPGALPTAKQEGRVFLLIPVRLLCSTGESVAPHDNIRL
jgi:hypothetical protein